MRSCSHRRKWNAQLGRLVGHDDRAAQLVEFAVSLPLLVVFVVGIFDFSGAFTLKQKLTNITRDAARAAAAEPTNDLTSTATPVSVVDTFWIVDNYLQANNINDCGMSLGATPSGLTWTFSVVPSAGSPCGITLTINRGYYFPAAGGQPAGVDCLPQPPGGSAVIATCVSIQYVYPWRFGRAASLLGSAVTLPTTINATAVAMNEN